MLKQLVRMAILVTMPFTVFAQSLELRQGDAVTTNDYYNGWVDQVFPDGVVELRIPALSSIRTFAYNIKQLSKPISCLTEVCAGNRITTDDYYNGWVDQVFSDGFAKVNIPELSSIHTYVYNIKQLSKPISCLSGICNEDTVTTNDHHYGVVDQIFPDGLVKVRIPSIDSVRTYPYKVKDLALRKK